MIVGEEIPGVTRFAIVLAYGAPLSLTQVGTPLLPRPLGLAAFPQARALRVGFGRGRLWIFSRLIRTCFGRSHFVFHCCLMGKLIAVCITPSRVSATHIAD